MSDLKNKPVAATPSVYYRAENGNLIIEDGQPGITLRQYYAGLALQGLLAAGSSLNDARPSGVARNAVKCANALIDELELIAELEKTDQ